MRDRAVHLAGHEVWSRMLPQSSIAEYDASVDSPVCGSTSTSAIWQPFGNVSGVSVTTLVSRSSLDLALLLHLLGAGGHVEQRQAAVGADHVEGAVPVLDVAFAGFEHVRGDLLSLRDHRLQRLHRVAGRHRRARADRGVARDLVGAVADGVADLVGRDAEPLGHQPREDRGVPLPGRLHVRHEAACRPGKITSVPSTGGPPASPAEADAEPRILPSFSDSAWRALNRRRRRAPGPSSTAGKSPLS